MAILETALSRCSKANIRATVLGLFLFPVLLIVTGELSADAWRVSKQDGVLISTDVSTRINDGLGRTKEYIRVGRKLSKKLSVKAASKVDRKVLELQGQQRRLRGLLRKLEKLNQKIFQEVAPELPEKIGNQILNLDEAVAKAISRIEKIIAKLQSTADKQKPKEKVAKFRGNWASPQSGLTTIIQDGKNMSGTWIGFGGGVFSGTIQGRVAAGSWRTSDATGPFAIELSKNGKSFGGTCNGPWTATRQR